MTTPPVIDALRRLAGPALADVSDADLLARYVADKDAFAFEALVRRHGGLVWGACRRRLKDPHAAEDAFQTTFLALARHAGAVRKPDAVGAWLHRVAVRCSAAFRRPPRELMSAPPPDVPARGPDPAAAAAGRDLERLIDAEIDALPEPYRLAFVLCEVEQRTAADAARALGCPVGTVESRLARARARLRDRLSRRGLAVGALIGLGLAAGPVPACAIAGAVAVAAATMRIPGAWAVIADKAARHGPTVLGVGLAGGMALTIGLGGLLWSLSHSADRPNPNAVALLNAPNCPELPVPETDRFRRNRMNFPLPPEAIARVGDPWLRHGTVPHQMAFSGDGRFLAAAGPGDRWLRVWDLSRSRPRAHLPLGANDITAAVALTQDGRTLRAVVHTGDAREAQLREYDTYRGQETRRRLVASGPVESATFGADGKQLALVREGRIRLLQADTAAELWSTQPPPGNGRTDVAFSAAGGKLAVIAAGTDRIRLLDLNTGRPDPADLVEPGTTLSLPTFSADGRRLAAWCAHGRSIKVWDVGNRGVAHVIEPRQPIAGIVFAPSGEEVVGFGGRQGPTLWPAQPGGRGRLFCDGFGGVTGRFSADGSVLALATVSGTIQLFDAKTGKLHKASPGEVLTPLPTAFSRDGDRLLLQGFQHWWEYATTKDEHPWVFMPGGRPNEPYLNPLAERTAVSPDRTMIARCTFETFRKTETVNGEKVVKTETQAGIDILNAATAAPMGRIDLDRSARKPVFSPDGKVLYAMVSKTVRGWDVRTGRELMRGRRNAGELVDRILVSADGKYLATADKVLTDMQRPTAIQVWDAATGEPVLVAEGGQARPHIAFSPDGRRFAAAVATGDPKEPAHEVRVWDLSTQTVIAAATGFDGQPAFSPDGRTVAVTRDDTVVLLELASGQVRHTFRHHGKVEPAVTWRSDGRVLAAASAEAPVYLWDIVGDRTGTVPAWDVAQDDRRWAALGGSEAPAAFQVVRQLWAHPVDAVPFLKTRMTAGADARTAARACEVLELIGSPDARGVLTAWARDESGPLAAEARDSLRRLGAMLN